MNVLLDWVVKDKSLLGILVVLVLITLDVELQWWLPFGVSQNAEGINDLIVNGCNGLSSGIIIYFLTCRLPEYVRRRKFRRNIEAYIENTNVIIFNMIARFPQNNGRIKEKIHVDDYLDIMEKSDWSAENQLPDYSKKMNLVQTFKIDYAKLKNHVINFLIIFKDCLTPEQVNALSEISSSSVEQLLDIKINPQKKDNPNYGCLLAENFRDVLVANEEIQKSLRK